ncbi:MAG: AAA family ATPase [Chloroflexi bacterium]|nr:AAA family ATPase [Chloroflexota bacterium]
MITRIELDGFKTFQGLELDLESFQVIVGPNGAGKSNLFDALRLLSRLADTDLRSAFQELRGDAGELFTTLPNGQSANRIRMAVEILVERRVQDSWGAQAELKYPRMRYELEMIRQTDEQGLERLYVTHESLKPISRGDDKWLKQHQQAHSGLPKITGGRLNFISTVEETGTATIYLRQDGHGGRKASVAEKIERTVLSGVNNTEFPHAFAAREEMRNWHFLQLNPEVLRNPSSMLARAVLSPDGSNLPSTLARMEAQDSTILADVSRELANLVPGILKIEVEKDQARNQYVIKAKTQDGRTFSSRVLSDGTLRMLALVTLKNDPQHRGVLCFEEPENGVHPFRLKNMALLLSELATDFSDPEQTEEPLRQLLVNTHSPAFISQPEVVKALLFAYVTSRVDPKKGLPAMRVTRIVPIRSFRQLELEGIGRAEENYTIDQIKQYLDSDTFNEARDYLEKSLI